MRKVLTVVLLLAACGGAVQAQVFNGRFVTSFYGWERQDTVGSSTSHLRAYENLQLNLGNEDISFHTYMQGTTDFQNEMTADPQLRLFNAYINVKNVADLFDVRLGRQSVYAGVNYGTFDGALLKVRPMNGIEVMAYGGGYAPPLQKPDFFQDVEHNWQAGAQALFYVVRNMKVGLSYMNRHRSTDPFTGYRLDPLNGLQETTIDYGSRANQYGSFNLSYLVDNFWLYGRYDYDFNFETTSRAEFAATWQAMKNLGISLDVMHREPVIAYNSYFSLLELNATQEVVLGADYGIDEDRTILARVSMVKYNPEDDYPGEDDISDMAYRVSLGYACDFMSLMYTKDISFDGDLDGLNFDLRYPLFDYMVIPHAGIVYSNYALSDQLEKSSTWAAVVGATYRPFRVLSFDVQGQYMTNKIYNSDMRGFLRINYWFNDPFNMFNEGGEK